MTGNWSREYDSGFSAGESPLHHVSEPEYWDETRRPWVSLIFLLPLLAVYEIGVLQYGGDQPETVRNGADTWMRGWLQHAGLMQQFLLPGLLIGGLLAWHLSGRQSWRVTPGTLAGMFAESLIFAFALVLLGQLTDFAFQEVGVETTLSTAATSRTALAVTFVGAGVYEEVMFRLCLLPCCFGAFRLLRLEPTAAALLAVLSSSLIFSLAHYVGEAGDTFDLFSFTFRLLAGLFFAGLFVTRGFGITVGCHAAYDLWVGVWLDFAG